MAAFLEVLTRCYKRPTMLAVNAGSLFQQTDDDWQQTHIVDDAGLGVGASYDRLAKQPVTGEYIWILDDDDMAIRETLVEELKAIAGEHDPDVIMLRMDHGTRGVLPDGPFWGSYPVCGHIGCSAYVVQRHVWQYHSRAFTPGDYNSDYRFICAVFDGQPEIYWHDVIASRVQRISLGLPE